MIDFKRRLISALRPLGLFTIIDKRFIKKYRELVLDEKNDFFCRSLGDLVDLRLSKSAKSASKYIFRGSYEISELVLRQYILAIFADQKLIRRLIYSKSLQDQTLIYPLPFEWASYFSDAGFKVNKIGSKFLLIVATLKYFIYGLVEFWMICFASLKIIFFSHRVNPGNFAYALNFPFEGDTSSQVTNSKRYDFLSWYWNWGARSASIEKLLHDNRALRKIDQENNCGYFPGPQYHISSLTSLAKFMAWGIISISICSLGLVIGRWCNALILCEALRSKATSLSPDEAVGIEYLLGYMGSSYRPLWTYEVENRGARVCMYFNSTSEEIKLPSGYRKQKFIFGLMNWPNYLVWDQYHAELLNENLNYEGNIQIADPLYYSDTPLNLPALPENTVAVFDIQPHKINLHFGISTLSNYRERHPSYYIEFLRDIYEVVSELEGFIAWKPKRSQPERMDGKYKKFIKKFEKLSNVASISAAVSPMRLINNCACVISAPFTSTGVYGAYCGRPSVYYDPTGLIQKDDKGAHGMAVLSNKSELREWLRENLFQKV